MSNVIFDELHTQPNRKLYDVMTKDSDDVRTQPLYFLITTAGNDEHSICYQVHQKAIDIMEGRKHDLRFYPVIYGAGSKEVSSSPEVWKKANPSLGITVKMEKVKDAISRFARNTIDCLKYIWDLKAINVAIFFEKENINTMDAKGEVLITIMASLAQQESESLSQNVKMGIQYRYQQGKVFVNHNHFLGYTKDDQGNLVIELEEAKVIKRIFYSYLNGMTMKQIADSLKADGILTGGKTKNWRSSSVAKILKNEKYISDALLQKTYTVDFLNKKRVKKEGIMPQYYVENDHPAIIPKSVFMQVQQIIKQRRNGITTRNGKHRRINGKYCFSQKVFCGKCGDILQRNMWYRPKKVAVWRCASRVRHSKTGRRCMIRNVKEPLLKEATVEAFNNLIEGHELASKHIKANIMKVIKNL